MVFPLFALYSLPDIKVQYVRPEIYDVYCLRVYPSEM